MSNHLLAIIDDEYEDLELWYPLLRFQEEGWKVSVAGPKNNHRYVGKNGYPITTHLSVREVDTRNYDALLLPGGYAPDKLRRDPDVLSVCQTFNTQEKVIGFICHAGWIPISAKIVAGRRCTSTPAIKDDLENAGALWSDQAVIIDGNLVSSRRPTDLPFFAKAMIALADSELKPAQNN